MLEKTQNSFDNITAEKKTIKEFEKVAHFKDLKFQNTEHKLFDSIFPYSNNNAVL